MTQLNKEFLENQRLNEEEIKQKRVFLQSRPRFLMLVLTTRCNLDCIMCGRVFGKSNLTIPMEVVKKFYSLMPYLEGINWQGGEVFLVDYFKEVFLEVAKYPNVRQSIITNGLLIDREWARLLVDSNVSLTYSIDAVTKETYEKIRRGASWENLLRSIEIINESNRKCNSGIQLHMNAVVMRSNYEQLSQFPGFCKNYNFSHLRFDFLQPGRPDITQEEYIFFIKQDVLIIEYLRNILPEIEQKCKELNIQFEYTFNPFLFKDNLESLGTQFQGNNSSKDFSNQVNYLKCKVPWKELFFEINPIGEVRPHCLCPHSIGNVMEASIEEIWNSKLMQVYRRRLIEGNISDWCSKICLSNAVDANQFEVRG